MARWRAGKCWKIFQGICLEMPWISSNHEHIWGTVNDLRPVNIEFWKDAKVNIVMNGLRRLRLTKPLGTSRTLMAYTATTLLSLGHKGSLQQRASRMFQKIPIGIAVAAQRFLKCLKGISKNHIQPVIGPSTTTPTCRRWKVALMRNFGLPSLGSWGKWGQWGQPDTSTNKAAN